MLVAAHHLSVTWTRQKTWLLFALFRPTLYCNHNGIPLQLRAKSILLDQRP